MKKNTEKQENQNFNNIPDELKELKQWVLWKKEKRKGKLTKVPYQPTGNMAQSNNPKTWTDFNTAVKAFNNGKYNGLGFVFASDDGITGIDIDPLKDKQGNHLSTIIDEDGKIVNEEARKIVDTFNSYTELSQSKNGVHILIYGEKPPDTRFKKTLKDKYFEIEVYNQGRYFCVTGETIGGYTTINDRQKELKTLCNSLLAKNKQQKTTNNQTTTGTTTTNDVDTVLQKAISSKHGNKIKSMLNGNLEEHGSPSERDQSLCNHLAFYTKDSTAIDQIIRSHPVYREKWDEKHFSDGTTYGKATIDKAIKDVSDQNNQKKQSTHTPSKVTKYEILDQLISEGNYYFRYNEISKTLEATKDGKPIDLKIAIADLSYTLEAEYGIKNVSHNKISEILLADRYCERFNPVNDFLSKIPEWNGKNNFKELMQYIRLPNDESPQFFEVMLRKTIIRAIRCATEPKYYNRLVTNLHGPQDTGKSSFISWLIPYPELYTSENIDLNDKDSFLMLAQNIIISLEELDQLHKSELAKLKAFISRDQVKIRLPYGRYTEKFNRIATLFGSTNQSEILADVSNTRWVFLKTISFDWKQYTANISPWDLWGEAMYYYNQNPENGELTDEEKQIRDNRNDTQFLESTDEREMLLKHFSEEEPAQPFTASEIKQLLESKYYPTKFNSKQIRRELHRMYGKPDRKTVKGRTGRFYFLQTDLEHEKKYFDYKSQQIKDDDGIPF